MQSRKDKGSHHNQKTEIFGKKSQLGLIIQTEFQTFLKIADPPSPWDGIQTFLNLNTF